MSPFPHAGDFSSQIAARVLELPYKGKAMSMFIFLPSEDGPGGFAKMVSRLGGNNVRAATNGELLNSRLVELQLPKFKLDVKVKGLIPVGILICSCSSFGETFLDVATLCYHYTVLKIDTRSSETSHKLIGI